MMGTSGDLYAYYLDREGLTLVATVTGLDNDLSAVEVVDPRGRRHFTIHDRRYPYPPAGEVFTYPEHEYEGSLPDHMLAKLRGEVAT